MVVSFALVFASVIALVKVFCWSIENHCNRHLLYLKVEQKFIIKAIKGQITILEDFKVDVSSISPLSEGVCFA